MSRHLSGWVKLHRKIISSWIWRDQAAYRVWSALILLANHDDSKAPIRGQMIPVQRGQMPTSAKDLAAVTGLERKTVLRKLHLLADDSAIVLNVSHSGTIVTLINYEKYQGSDVDDCPTDGSTDGTEQRTAKRTAKGTHNGEEKKRRKKEDNPPISPLAPAWPEDHPMAKVFTHLVAVPAYRAIFNLSTDQEAIQSHMGRYGLSLEDMEQIAFDLKHWAPGQKLKSPRGTLATFVRNFVKWRGGDPQPDAEPGKTWLDYLTPEERARALEQR